MGVFKKRNRLSKLGLDEISLVPSGDDPTAEVVIAKTDKTHDHDDESRTLIDSDSQGAFMPTEDENQGLDMTGIDPEVAAYIAALEEEVQRNDVIAEILAMADGDTTEVTEDTTEVTAEADAEQLVLAKADPAIRSLIEKAEQRAEAAEEIAKAERDLRVHREFVAKAASMPMITEQPEQLAEVFKALNDADPALAEVVTEILSAANQQIAKGNLFGEFGSSATTELGGGEAGAKAEQIRKENPDLTPEQALVAAYEADPNLYTDSLEGA